MMKFSTLFAASVFAATVVAAAPLPDPSGTTEYHYFLSDGTDLPLANRSLPITVGGVPIGTIELPSNNASGTIHHLSSGHHFGHRDWVVNGSSWQYNEGYRDRRTNHKVKMATANTTESSRILESQDLVDVDILSIDHLIFMYKVIPLDGEEMVYESGVIQSAIGVAPPFSQINWAFGGQPYTFVDLWASDNVYATPIASFVELVDDVLNLLFDAFSIYAYF